jgi:hypothetical protein
VTPEEIMLRVRLEMDAERFDPRPPRPALVYSGPADFVLQHGRVYSNWIESPRKMIPGFCYGNAIVMCVLHGLKYVEGYALSPFLEVIPHAWNTNDAGDLIDSTWLMRGRCYLGVEFSVERADDCSWNGDACVLNDFVRGWPLLQERWYGEPPDLKWPASERIEILRAGDRDRALEWMTKERTKEFENFLRGEGRL